MTADRVLNLSKTLNDNDHNLLTKKENKITSYYCMGIFRQFLLPEWMFFDPFSRIKKYFQEKKVYLPHAVVEKHVMEDKSLVRSWREHKGLSQKEMAERMSISQAAYSQMEKLGAKLRTATCQKIAAALEIDTEKLKA